MNFLSLDIYVNRKQQDMRLLKKGDQGQDVAELQALLIAKGYGVTADGDFGAKTDAAIKDYQSKHGLTPDGIVGNMTWNSLKGEAIVTYNTVQLTVPITEYALEDDEYYKEIIKKDTIYLHHTAGGSRPDYSIQGWERDKSSNGGVLKVATAFVMGRSSSSSSDTSYDGKIYRAFHEKYWAHHLGSKQANNKILNQKSIAIEICNYGPLTKTKDGKYINYVNREVLPQHVIELKESFKGYKFYERYTDGQLTSLKALLLDLANSYNIDLKNNFDESWFKLNQKAMDGVPGLWTHVNIISSKFDLFPQPELIDMLKTL